ncbi:MAG TPA: hypothetical protein VGI70_03035, partial [Polyangiales bacterium]
MDHRLRGACTLSFVAAFALGCHTGHRASEDAGELDARPAADGGKSQPAADGGKRRPAADGGKARPAADGGDAVSTPGLPLMAASFPATRSCPPR